MKEKLIAELEKFGYPVFLQGSLNENAEYPASFITFFVDDTPDNSHYDNETASYAWYFSVIFYSNDPSLVDTVPKEILKALKAAGFTADGKGRDIPSDAPTHTGWAMDLFIIEYQGG